MSARKDRAARGRRTGWARVRRLLTWLVVLGVVGALALSVLAFVTYQRTTIPNPNAAFLTQTTRIFYADGKTEIGRLAVQQRTSIDYDQMPDCIKQGVVAAENRTFWTDKGIDPKGIVRAAFSNVQGNSTQGASTITQQYVKILYLTQERSIKRKIREAFLSLKIQNELSKTQILTGYLNTIYFGRGAYGIEAAAHAWFDVDAKALSLRQCAVLSSVLNNPVGLDPANGGDSRQALLGRFRYVLVGMAQAGDITAAQAQRAERRLPTFPRIKAQNTYGGRRGHVLTLVKQQLLALKGANGDPLFTEQQIVGGGLKITTTLTKQAMDAAQSGVLAVRPASLSDKNLHVGVASVEPRTGALRGFYGGQDFLESQLDWATQRGMAGSTMKAFTLAAAIKQGYSLRDTFDGNSPYVFPDGLQVTNEQDTSYGSAITMTKAMEDSVNTAFVDMTVSMDNGPKSIYDEARAMGLPPVKASGSYPGIPSTSTDLSPDDQLISLGKARVSPVNLADAYATIAAGGVHADAYVIGKVTDAEGKVLYQHRVADKRVLPEDIDSDVSYALQQVVSQGTGTAALALGRPAAGKTGTATNSKNQVSSAWFVGYTPQLATAVMYVRGDGDNQLDGWLPDYNGQAGYFGGNYPARTWTAVMTAALAGQPVQDFPSPANVDGTPPQSGHTYVPPPATSRPPSHSPSRRPSPSRSPSRSPSAPASSQPPATTQPPASSAPPSSVPPSTAPPTSPPTSPTASIT